MSTAVKYSLQGYHIRVFGGSFRVPPCFSDENLTLKWGFLI